MGFDSTLIDEIDQDTVETEESVFPTIQWAYGSNKLKAAGNINYHGGFFISESNVPGGVNMEAKGWKKEIYVPKDDEIEGWATRQLSFSVINKRHRWELKVGNRTLYFPWAGGWEAAKAAGEALPRPKSPSGRIQCIVLIKGMEEAGPLVLTMKGTAGMALDDRRKPQSVLQHLTRTVKAAADLKTKPQRWPLRAFWVTVRVDQDAKGNPIFTKVGSDEDSSNLVLPVAFGLPEKASEVNLDDFALDKDTLRQANAIHSDTLAWASAWDTIEPGTAKGEDKDREPAVEVADDAVAAAGL